MRVSVCCQMSVGPRVVEYSLYAHGIKHEPFVDGFGRMRHKDAAIEICFCQHVRERGSVIHVETTL